MYIYYSSSLINFLIGKDASVSGRLRTKAEETRFVTEKILFSFRQELRLKKQFSSLIDFELLLLFVTDIGYKYVAMIPRNLIVCIKTLCFSGKIFKYLISRENNTQNAPEVLLSADILYIVLIFMLTSSSSLKLDLTRGVLWQLFPQLKCVWIWLVLLTQYCAGDKMGKNEMGWACGAYGWGE